MTDLRDCAKQLNRYYRNWNGGAFASPPASELTSDNVVVTNSYVAVVKSLTRAVTRRDWRGLPQPFGPGRIVTHFAPLGRLADPLPDDIQTVFAIGEDRSVADYLAAQGWVRSFTAIAASSQITGGWGRCAQPETTDSVDAKPLASLPVQVDAATQRAIELELASVDQWHDDFPYYSDGSWDAISLRGYRPDDPTWGVKPSEMGKSWHAAHPGARALRADWTALAAKMPAMVGLVLSFAADTDLDRVRLMRMDGTRGSELRRHTDITDKQAGTRTGQMVRWMIPITTDPAVVTSVWDLDGTVHQRHLAAWQAHYLDIRRPHAVSNRSGKPRVQLAIDMIVNDDVRRLVATGV